MSRRGHAARTAALLAMGLALAACRGGDGPRVLKLAHGLPTSHPVHRAMVFMAERVREASADRLRIDIHPSEQLGTERESIELLQIGSLAMAKVSTSVLEGFVPIYGVFSLPYLFRDEAHRQAVLDGEVGAELLLAGESVGLRGLVYYDAGSRSFYTRERPIRTPADLRGLKIRTQESPTSIRMVQALGGSATPIAWGELYTALQQGVVDGAENNPPSFHLSRHYEVCRYYSLDEHTATPDVLLIGTAVWRSLSPEERSLLEEAARASAELQRELWRDATRRAMEAVAAAGVEILRPDPRPFAEAVQDIYVQLRARPEQQAAVERIRSQP